MASTQSTSTDNQALNSEIAPSLQTLREHKSQILSIFNQHGCFDVRVFGSTVRGDSTAESDIDFLCDYDLDKTPGFFPGGLIAELEDFLGFSVDVVFPSALDAKYIGETIKQDLVAL